MTIPELSPIEWISVASFSLGLATLAVRFFTKPASARAQLLIVAFIFVIASATVAISQYVARSRSVMRLAERILESIGNQEKPTEQIQVELNFPDSKLFASAMAMLERDGIAASRVIYVVLPTQQTAPLRIWRVTTTNTTYHCP